MSRNLQRISLYVKRCGGLVKPLIVKEAPPRKNYIPPGIDGSKKTRGVFSIMRTKLVLANFDRGWGVIVVRRLYNVQNTVNGIGIWDPMSIWGVG
jgi:hypothetical protein